MEQIKIIWCRDDGMKRIDYQLDVGNMRAALKIFSHMEEVLKALVAVNGEIEQKN